ncbi:MAG: HD domain-containing protein, partial [Deferribacteres bacterium]|nr:HD domain-containing protein [Deferribacteres bacterium]
MEISGTVLFIDDETHVLNSLDSLFTGTGLKILKAADPREALELFGKEEIAVIVSDNHMPAIKGIDLLQKVRDVSPDTLRILMTAYADLVTAVDAINKGELFRFIVKPWEDNALVQTVHDAVKHYHLVRSLKTGDEATLLGIAQTIELKDPHTQGHCENVASYAMLIAGALNLSGEEKKHLLYGSWLHDCGKINIPDHILDKKSPLIKEEYEIIKNHPRWGADLALQAKMPPSVVNIILHHHERYDGSGYPSGIKGRDIPIEARIVTVADVYDALTSERA